MNTNELLGLHVREVMSTNLITVQHDTLLRDVNNIFQHEQIHHLPVVDGNGRFEGIISKSDLLLLMDWGTKFNLPASVRKNAFLLGSNMAKDIMETSVIKVRPDDTVRKCVQLFKENYFRALPVVIDTGTLVGIITTYDLMILAYKEVLLLP